MINDITINKILKIFFTYFQRRRQFVEKRLQSLKDSFGFFPRNRLRSYRRCLTHLCSFVCLLTVIIIIGNETGQLRRLRRWFYKPSDAQLRVIAARYGKFLNRSNSTSIDSSGSYQPSISPYHPHLPILLLTENFTSLKNTTKLILLANGFFDSEKWGLNSMDQSSTAISNNPNTLKSHDLSFIF